MFLDIGLGDYFLDMTPEAHGTKKNKQVGQKINGKASTEQEKQSAKWKDKLWNGKKCWQTIWNGVNVQNM